MIRRWFVALCVEILTQFYERVIRPDVCFCGHGYIETTCGICGSKP